MKDNDKSTAAPADDRFPRAFDDLVVVPLAAIAFAVARCAARAGVALVRIVDWAFPILLQIMRFPLFTARIVGDVLVALGKGIIRCLPVSPASHQRWTAGLVAAWSWLRARISFAVFEEAVHRLFEGGMAWVFRTCRTLTPRNALLVLLAAVAWLPISFAVATGMHAWLLAYATSLPPALQLLHPVATVVAKSKLLVLPVYPAAWPQAKQHPLMRAMADFCRWLASRHLVRKFGHRYGQLAAAATALSEAIRRSTLGVSARSLARAVRSAAAIVAAKLARAARIVMAPVLRALAAAPLIGPATAAYAARYDDATRAPAPPVSRRVRGFFARWSIKFTAEYYEQHAATGSSKTRSPA